MSYQSQATLEADYWFQQRTRAVTIEQAEVYKNDARPSFVATADAVLREEGGIGLSFVRLGAAAPGIADKADNGDGTVDQAKVTDDDLLSLTQANWQVVAALYFDEEGNPIP